MQGPHGPYGANPYHMQPGPPMMPPFQCRACGYAGQAMTLSKVSTGGWVVFAILLFVCFPLFWIPLITMKDRRAQCPQCRIEV